MLSGGSLEKSGYVLKKSQIMRQWNSRFVVADPRHLRLRYYKEAPKSEIEKERGTLPLTGCTVSLDASCDDSEYRFLVTTRDHKETYHLEVDDEFDQKEWIRVIKLISDLGVACESVAKEMQLPVLESAATSKSLRSTSTVDTVVPEYDFDVLGKACHVVLDSMSAQAKASRQSLDDIAKHKWNAKKQLSEARKQISLKLRTLEERMKSLRIKDTAFNKDLARFSSQKENLEIRARRSNELQKEIVELFAFNREPACKECTAQLASGKSLCCASSSCLKSKARAAATLCENRMQSARGVDVHSDATRQRARSLSDPSAAPSSKKTIYEEQMLRFLIRNFAFLQTAVGSPKASAAVVSVVNVLQLYEDYYVEVHNVIEEELKVCLNHSEQMHASIGFVRNKHELARREQDEVTWILSEMQRAILKLSREGVKADESMASITTTLSATPTDTDMRPGAKESSDVVAVVAHRATWAESSETIFQLNAFRAQERSATKTLEDSLTSREMVRGWFQHKFAVA